LTVSSTQMRTPRSKAAPARFSARQAARAACADARMDGGGAGLCGQLGRSDGHIARGGRVIGQRRRSRQKRGGEGGEEQKLSHRGSSFSSITRSPLQGGSDGIKENPSWAECVLSRLKSRSFFQS
jgi:hypothetical protein